MVAPHRSAISWTDYSGGDANFVTGCTPVSEGCRNCYAKAIYERFGRDFGTVRYDHEQACRLLGWEPDRTNLRRGPGSKPMCFVCDTSDLLHPDAVHPYYGSPNLALWRAAEVLGRRTDINWQILTKRAEELPRWKEAMRSWAQVETFDHIWLGVSVENQARADERLPMLLEVSMAVRFVSVEPMLGPVDLREYLGGLSWVICGAESGPNRRPFDVQWALDLYHQCREAGVPFFYKQGSALRPGCNAHLPGYGVVQEWPRV